MRTSVCERGEEMELREIIEGEVKCCEFSVAVDFFLTRGLCMDRREPVLDCDGRCPL